MTLYRRLYKQAEVLDRWADIYGGETTYAAMTRLEAARLRLWAELVKALRLEEIAGWVDRRL